MTLVVALWALVGLGQNPPPPVAVPPVTVGVRGTVVDGRTKAPILDAQVAIVDLGQTVRTTSGGRFELKGVASGTHTLTVSMIGYVFVRRELQVGNAAIDLTIPLSEGTGTYQETVNVTADATPPPAIGVASQMVAGSAALQELRGVTTDDPLRAMQALPGVATGDDFQADFSVRGAAFRHLGVVIDGTPTAILLHSVHARENTGSIAMINTDVLESAALFAGAHPPRHGDWIGATLEFSMREGSRDRTTVRAAVSGTSASAVFEGPIGPNKRGSWLASVRKSYIDWLIRKLEPGVDSTIGFYDGQLKVVYDLTSRQQLQVIVVGGDAIYREERASVANGLLRAASGSTLASVAWRYVRDRAITTQRVSFLGGDFRNRGVVGQGLARGYTQSIVARTDVAAPLGRGWALDLGIRGEWSRINQILADFVTINSSSVRLRSARDESARWTVASVFAQAARRTPAGGVALGARVSRRSGGAGMAASPFLLAERRLGAWTIRGSTGLAAQFPDPSLFTADRTVDPERARFVDLSIEHRLGKAVRWHVTAFDRREADVLRRISEDRLDPTRGTRIVASTFPQYRASLEGTARGVDLVVSRQAPSGLTGWIGYTWSHARYHDTASGERFDGDFDQRHTLNAFVQQRLSYRLAVSAKLRIGSNFPVVGYFDEPQGTLRLGATRNAVRLPRYARLDLRANRTFTFDRRRLTLFVEVMNATGRENFGQADGSIRANLEAVGYGERLIPLVPSAGFLIEF